MRLHNIRIRDFKSLYGDNYFDFDTLDGLVKLSGAIGSGKTSLGEAIIWGLFGTIKKINNTHLIAWNTKACEIEINLESKGHNINILRNIKENLQIHVDGKLLIASNKRDTQQILEEEYFDVPKLTVIKMCVISFNEFNSIAAMNPGETKQFLDNVFGFKTFTEYNEQSVVEKKEEVRQQTELNAIYTETENQMQYLINKKSEQQKELSNSIDIDKLTEDRAIYVDKGKALKDKFNELTAEYKQKDSDMYNKMLELSTLGKVAKNNYNTFKSGKCPTCGHEVDNDKIEEYKSTMLKYAASYKEIDASRIQLKNEYQPKIDELNKEISELRTLISDIDTKIKIHENNKRLINENYDALINEYKEKLVSIKSKIDKSDIEIGEWNEIGDLFAKTLRYNLLDTLIPNINSSIQYYMNKLDQNYSVEFDKEFKPHIYIDGYQKEISYNSLSTGQRKTLDMAVIFGVLQNIIANVNFNVFFLDELFSNLDSDSRNTMLDLLNSTLAKDRSIFVINHAEMNDDYFKHKIRVKLSNKKIKDKKDEIAVRASIYDKVFFFYLNFSTYIYYIYI